MGMSSKEIASLMNIEVISAQSARYRLRKIWGFLRRIRSPISFPKSDGDRVIHSRDPEQVHGLWHFSVVCHTVWILRNGPGTSCGMFLTLH